MITGTTVTLTQGSAEPPRHAPEQQRQTPISPSTSITMADEQAPEIQINVKGAPAAAALARAY